VSCFEGPILEAGRAVERDGLPCAAVNTYRFVVGPETPYSLNRVGPRHDSLGRDAAGECSCKRPGQYGFPVSGLAKTQSVSFACGEVLALCSCNSSARIGSTGIHFFEYCVFTSLTLPLEVVKQASDLVGRHAASRPLMVP
jgi:hypothetical protein